MKTIFKILLFLLLFLFTFYLMLKEPRKILGEEIYISAQPSKEKLLYLISKYKIKTVINLRGKNEGKRWYKEEKNILDEKNINLLNLKFSENKPPPRYELLKFIENFEKIKYPILIHCRNGKNRSTFFSFIFMLLKDNKLEERLFFKKKIWEFYDDFKKYCQMNKLELNSFNLNNFIKNNWVPSQFSYDLNIKSIKGKGLISFTFDLTNKSKRMWQFKNSKESGIKVGGKLFGPFEKVPENLERYFYENENKGSDVLRAGFFDKKIMPSESIKLFVDFKLSSDKGIYLLAIDVVDENVNWFYYYGKAPNFFILKYFD